MKESFSCLFPSSQKTKEKNEDKLTSFIAENLEATTKEMAVHLGITENGVEYIIRKLKEEGRLKRTGGRKEGKWELIK